jgi:hypothetical protein
MLKVISAVLLLHPVSSFQISRSNQITHRTQCLSSSRNTRLFSASDEEVEDEDPYGDLLNFKKPVETENSKDLIKMWSIASSIDSGSLVKVKGPPKTAQQQWEHWDDFMEEQFGNMDAEVPDNERWQIDMRDMVEQKRGDLQIYIYLSRYTLMNIFGCVYMCIYIYMRKCIIHIRVPLFIFMFIYVNRNVYICIKMSLYI